MKKTWMFIVMLICTVAATVAFSATAFAAKTAGTAYYVSSSTGNDNNDGKSELTPWKTLNRVNATVFSPGDSILLKTGDTWEEELILHGNGAVGDTLLPITLSSYGNEGRPIIAPGGTDRTCLTINGLEGWEIRGLELCNAYQGILISYHDVFEKDYADDIYRTYIVNVGACNSWTGTLKQLRLDIVDNVSSGVVSINEIRLTAHPGENYASWTFSGENNSDGWQLINHVRGNAAGGSLNLGIAGSDPYIYSPDYLNLNLDHCRYIRIDMANATYATEGRVYWTTTQDTNWSEDKSAAFTILTGRQDLNSYIIDLGYNVNWKGILKQIRLDFVDQLTAGNVNIDAVYIY